MPTTFKSTVEKPNYYKLNAIAAVNNKSYDNPRVLINNSRRNGDESFFTDKNGKSVGMFIDEGGSIEVNSADFDEEKLLRTERIVLHLAELNRENLKM